MPIIGVTYSNQKVSAADHAKLFQMLIGDGILNGCSASARLNVFTVSEGKFITAGRVAKIQGSETITISSEYGTGWYARVKLVNDLSQAAEINEFKQVKFEVDYAESIASFPEITQENINEDGSTGKYEIVWAILTLGENGVITAYDVKVGPASGGSGGGGTGQPIFTFTPSDGTTGGYTIIDDDNGDWRIKFLKSGTLVFTGLGNASNGIDIFLVGGGGGSSVYGTISYSGGGGGYTITSTAFIPSVGTEYPIVVGNGGAPGQNGESTIAFGYTAEGGKTGNIQNGGNGGSGGGSGSSLSTPSQYIIEDGKSKGGSDGNNGARFESKVSASQHWNYEGGTGQGSTTKEFKEPSGALYAGGGAGLRASISNDQITSWVAVSGGEGGGGNSNANTNGDNGAVNTGGGGGAPNGSGGSGIVIIRNHRSNPAA